MKVGSIVVAVGLPAVHEITRPDHGIIVGNHYVVNWIGVAHFNHSLVRIGFEETPQDIAYAPEFFREIEFPDDLQEEIKECLTREFESV